MTPAGGSAGCRIEFVASGGQPREVARENADDRVGTAVRQTEDRVGVDREALATSLRRLDRLAVSSRRKISAVADETMRERR
jgi:hypothetical protein